MVQLCDVGMHVREKERSKGQTGIDKRGLKDKARIKLW